MVRKSPNTDKFTQNLKNSKQIVYFLTNIQKFLFGLVSSKRAYPNTKIGKIKLMKPAFWNMLKIMAK